MIYVRIEKVAVAAQARSTAGEAATYPHGNWAATSLPVNYWVEGWMEGTPTVDRTVTVWRTIRNGVVFFGKFESTCVQAVGEDVFTTINSYYRWWELDRLRWPLFSDLPAAERDSFRASGEVQPLPAGASE